MLVLKYGVVLVSLYCFEVGTLTSKHIRGVKKTVCLIRFMFRIQKNQFNTISDTPLKL